MIEILMSGKLVTKKEFDLNLTKAEAFKKTEELQEETGYKQLDMGW